MQTFLEINPTFCFTLLGTFVIYVSTRPARAAWLSVLGVAMAEYLGYAWMIGSPGTYYGARWIGWGACLGIATLVVLAEQIFLAPVAEKRLLRQTFNAAAVFPLCSLLIGYTIPLTTWLRPKTYDAFLLAFDAGLGGQPSFFLGRSILRDSILWGPTTVVYYALPLASCALYGSYRLQKQQSVALLALLLSMMAVGFTLYAVYPAVGPRYAFPEWYPWHAPALAEIAPCPMSVPGAPRNCMPSLHLAAALVVWWNSRIWPGWARILVLLFLLATIFSTLALGEHYVADLVVAFPFALAFQAAWTRAGGFPPRKRRSAIWLGAGFSLVWMALLRFGLGIFLISPMISWTLVLLTVSGCMVMERNVRIVSREGS